MVRKNDDNKDKAKKEDKAGKTAGAQSKALARAMEMLEQGSPPAASRSLGELIAGTQAPLFPQSLIPIASAADIGRLVRAARRRMDLNQQEFADLAGVGRRFVSELEGGKPSVEFAKVLQVCAAAGIDVSASTRAS